MHNSTTVVKQQKKLSFAIIFPHSVATPRAISDNPTYQKRTQLLLTMTIIAESSDDNLNAPPSPAAPSLPQQRGNYSDNLETLAQAAPWIDDALQQARQAQQTIETAIEGAITVTKSRLDRVLTTSSAHFNQTLVIFLIPLQLWYSQLANLQYFGPILLSA